MRALNQKLPIFLLCILAAVVIGCGGGGGGGSSTDGSTNATDGTNATNANGSNANGTNANGETDGTNGIASTQFEALDADVAVDPGSVKKGDSLQLRLFTVSSTGKVTFPTSVTFTTDAAASLATLSSKGVLKVVGTDGTFRVSANGSSTRTFTIRPANEAYIQGIARNESGKGVSRAGIEIFNGSGGKIRSTETGSDGSFRIAVPDNASTFDVNFAKLSGLYYNVWAYRGGTYSPSVCRAIVPLPAFRDGQTTELSGTLRLYAVSNQVPPVPTCEVPE